MYVKSFSIRLHHAAQRCWHEVCWEYRGSEPRGKGNYWRSTKEHGKQVQRSRGVADPVKFQVRHWEPRVGGNWGSRLVTGLENVRRRQLVHQIQIQIILGILCEMELGKIKVSSYWKIRGTDTESTEASVSWWGFRPGTSGCQCPRVCWMDPIPSRRRLSGYSDHVIRVFTHSMYAL